MRHETLVERASALLRRRAWLLLGAGSALAVGGGLLLAVLPERHLAQVRVAPEAGRFEGPITPLRELASTPAVLDPLAVEAGVLAQRTLGEWLAGLPSAPGERLAARVDPAPAAGPVEHLVVSAQAADAATAERAAALLARAVVARDAAREPRGGATAATGSATAASAHDLRERLEVLREQNPLLRDPTLVERVQVVAARVSDDQVALASLRAQAEGAGEEAERLELLVKTEAAHALRLHREEEAAQRALAATRAQQQPAARAAHVEVAPAPPPPPPSRVAELEAELARLLASRTVRHPDVRRVQRLLEAERARPAPAPAPRRTAPASHDAPEVARLRDAPDLVLAAADEPDAPAGIPLVEAPPEWLQRAPSYARWVEARGRESSARLTLESREQEAAARRLVHESLTRAQQELAAPRVEEARLVAALELERRAGERGEVVAAPLSVMTPLGVVSRTTPWDHLPLGAAAAALLALLLAVGVDLQDRTVRSRDEVEDELGVPVLGSIPHLRRGRIA